VDLVPRFPMVSLYTILFFLFHHHHHFHCHLNSSPAIQNSSHPCLCVSIQEPQPITSRYTKSLAKFSLQSSPKIFYIKKKLKNLKIFISDKILMLLGLLSSKKIVYQISTQSICAHLLQFLNHLTELCIKVMPGENIPTS
jgi:predicted transcriptional regulator